MGMVLVLLGVTKKRQLIYSLCEKSSFCLNKDTHDLQLFTSCYILSKKENRSTVEWPCLQSADPNLSGIRQTCFFFSVKRINYGGSASAFDL